MARNVSVSHLAGLVLWATLSVLCTYKAKPTFCLQVFWHQQAPTFSVDSKDHVIYEAPLQNLELTVVSSAKRMQGGDRLTQMYDRFAAMSSSLREKKAQALDNSIQGSMRKARLFDQLSRSSHTVKLQESQREEAVQLEGQNGQGHGNQHQLLLIYILVPVALGGLLLSVFIGWKCYHFPFLKMFAVRIASQHHVPERNELSLGPWQKPVIAKGDVKQGTLCKIDYATIEAATEGFSSANLLGEGGFGNVYKAKLGDDCYAAVKKLFEIGHKAEKNFQAEIELMERLRHPNLLSFIGFSSREHQYLLVYELMENGSLYDHLQGPLQGSLLDWNLRLKIALDAARGLEQLHDHCNPPVIHRDFKSSNILLDQNFNAKLSDFGLALSMPKDTRKGESHLLQGTLGYIAPEYILTGSLTEKSDVYAYGVVLLELLTGRKPIDSSMPTGCESLVTWVTPFLTDRNKLPTILAPVLEQTVSLKQLYQLAAIAVLCVQAEPGYRPLIGDVVNSLIPLVPVEHGGTARPARSVSSTVETK